MGGCFPDDVIPHLRGYVTFSHMNRDIILRRGGYVIRLRNPDYVIRDYVILSESCSPEPETLTSAKKPPLFLPANLTFRPLSPAHINKMRIRLENEVSPFRVKLTPRLAPTCPITMLQLAPSETIERRFARK